MTRVALGIDVRVRAFLGEVGNVLQLLEAGGQRDLHVLFLDASDETLLRRFSETRRPHPLSTAGAGGSEGALAVLDGVRVERERLAPLRARATRVIDTTNTSVHELRRDPRRALRPGVRRRARGWSRASSRSASSTAAPSTPTSSSTSASSTTRTSSPGCRLLPGLDAAGGRLRPRSARDPGVPAPTRDAPRVRPAAATSARERAT